MTLTTGRLIFCGVVLIGVACAAVPVFTGWWPGGFAGYVLVLALYWALFCIPVGVLSGAYRLGISWRVRGAVWVPVLILVQALSYAVYGLVQGLASLPVEALALGALAALVNAPLEEFAWRGAYLSVARRNPLVQAVGVWIFTLWHVPLMFASGVDFGENTLVVLMGVFALGSVWAIGSFWTGALGWAIVGHVIVNMVAFPALLAANM